MTLIQRIRAQDAGRAVADLFAADYLGALLGGLAFPFLLLPLGQATGALVTGAVNAVAGLVIVLWLFRGELAAGCPARADGRSRDRALPGVRLRLRRFRADRTPAAVPRPIVHAERSVTRTSC